MAAAAIDHLPIKQVLAMAAGRSSQVGTPPLPTPAAATAVN